MQYPKIQTAWNRSKETFQVIPGDYRRDEFKLVKMWVVTEKIDGMNIRVIISEDGSISFAGRTDRAQLPKDLVAYLETTFTPECIAKAFEPGLSITLFGEGYGAGIQKGGGYRKEKAFRLFDVLVGDWWLDWLDVIDVAEKLEINMVPTLGTIREIPRTLEELDVFGKNSVVARWDSEQDILSEGIVCRTVPQIYDKRGHRVMFKLKRVDFKKGKR